MSIVMEHGEIRYLGTGVDINPKTTDWELYIMGEFICSWGGVYPPPISNVIVTAVEHGKHLRSKEIRKLLGGG